MEQLAGSAMKEAMATDGEGPSALAQFGGEVIGANYQGARGNRRDLIIINFYYNSII